jgi:2-oxoisovalerate dehydrogenase E1 component
VATSDPTTPAALDEALLVALATLAGPPSTSVEPPAADEVERLQALFTAQVISRQLDLTARWMRTIGRGYYTIGSAGHEANGAVALATRPSDPALLHYRSGAFYAARAAQVAGHDPVDDVLLGMLAAVDEPIAGGRHKVFGNAALSIIPQTSTIASHLPRALGIAFTLGRRSKLHPRLELAWPDDAIVVCSFGDASANHSTATGAINAACRMAHQHQPLPLLLVCEDNGLGISVPTPHSWIEAAYGSRPGLRYVHLDGEEPAAMLAALDEAVAQVRERRRPTFVHLRTVRYLGHAGTDAEAGYRGADDVRRSFARDPIATTGRALHARGVDPEALVQQYRAAGEAIRRRAEQLFDRAELTSRDAVMRPLAQRSPSLVSETLAAADAASTAPVRAERPVTLAQAINATLAETLTDPAHPDVLVFGEDVAVKGGVYGVTKGLLALAGPARVFDTVLDEQTILGLALGAAVSGLVAIPEIQYLAYLHNAEDQLRGEAATLQFFSDGQYRNGMVVRIAGYGYQRGFGGHFHNDNGVAVLRDIPGLVVASPARPADAAAMLRTCVAAARLDGTVCVFLEPIALYHTVDLHETGDGAWAERLDDGHVPIGAPRTYGDGRDLTIVTWANGLAMSLRVAERLRRAGELDVRVVDLRWLAPLPMDDVVREAEATGRVLVVDETRHGGGVGEGVVTGLVERGFGGLIARVASADSFVPLGDAARLVLLAEDEIEAAIRRLATT